jgi:hypothetical protein
MATPPVHNRLPLANPTLLPGSWCLGFLDAQSSELLGTPVEHLGSDLVMECSAFQSWGSSRDRRINSRRRKVANTAERQQNEALEARPFSTGSAVRLWFCSSGASRSVFSQHRYADRPGGKGTRRTSSDADLCPTGATDASDGFHVRRDDASIWVQAIAERPPATSSTAVRARCCVHDGPAARPMVPRRPILGCVSAGQAVHSSWRAQQRSHWTTHAGRVAVVDLRPAT